MHRGLLLSFCLLLAAGCTGRQQEFDPQEDAAIAEIEDLGGRVDYDEARPGVPAVKVDFTGTRVGDEVLDHLKGLPQIEVVDLAGTNVTDKGLEQLKGLSTLKRVRLHGTRVTGEGVKKLQQALPELVIEQ